MSEKHIYPWWAVVNHHGTRIKIFSGKLEAIKYASELDLMQGLSGSYTHHVAENSVTVFDTCERALKEDHLTIRKRALAKLSPEEKFVLGIH